VLPFVTNLKALKRRKKRGGCVQKKFETKREGGSSGTDKKWGLSEEEALLVMISVRVNFFL